MLANVRYFYSPVVDVHDPHAVAAVRIRRPGPPCRHYFRRGPSSLAGIQPSLAE
jgi:hypothetical protein